MVNCYFISDLHGHKNRFDKLFKETEREKPAIIFNGGDVVPHGLRSDHNFISDYLIPKHKELKDLMDKDYPEFLYILGNDDPRSMEELMFVGEEKGLWKYIHNKKIIFNNYTIAGYAYVPPTPFRLKDWERYDVSRYTDPGCISPEEGIFTTNVNINKITYSTILEDILKLTENTKYERLILLSHSPPYKTKLDMISTKGIMIDNVEPDNHVGSIAIKRFIENNNPYLTLHGHIHESTELSGSWLDKIGSTISMNAATDMGKLSIIKFPLEDPSKAERFLL